MSKGKVYLVGAGPGAPDLMSVRGAQLLATADTIVYDRLIPSLQLLPVNKNARMIDVGKEAKKHRRKQSEINQILIDEAKAGNKVVRLKGGDCFVFGRGGEEAIELKKAGITFEVVPGITSSISVPAYAGIPVTHRGVSTEFAVVTGHEDPTKGKSTINWPNLAKAVHTLVFLMGVKNLEYIVTQLIDNGRSGDTPAAIIYKGCSWEQKVLTCKLSELPEKAKKEGFVPPSITVIGDVVSKREEIGRWFEELPLMGKSFLCTRPDEQNRELALELTRLGGRAIISSLIEVKARECSEELKEAFTNLSQYDWTVFTSSRGVSFFFEQLKEEGRDSRSFGHCKIAAIGTTTARTLESYGIVPDLIPEQFTAEGLLESFAKLNDEHPLNDMQILVPRASGARQTLVAGLSKNGAKVTEIHTYDTIQTGTFSKEAVTAIANDEVDRVILCSPSTVESYVKALEAIDKTVKATSSPTNDDAKSSKPTNTETTNSSNLPLVTAIGPVTAQRARELNLEVSEVATVYTIEGIIAACQRCT